MTSKAVLMAVLVLGTVAVADWAAAEPLELASTGGNECVFLDPNSPQRPAYLDACTGAPILP